MNIVWLALLVQFAVVEAFTSSARVLPLSVVGHSSSTTFCRHHLGDLDHDVLPEETGDDRDSVVVFDTVAVAMNDAAWETAMKFVAALVAASLVTSGGLFQTRPAFAADLDSSLFARGIPTMVVSADVKDSEIADFSMPSYESATRAKVNDNLKGEKFLLGEASKTYGDNKPSSSSPSEATSNEKKPVVVVDEKAEKAAAKAAIKAARAQQQAEMQANIDAKAAAAKTAEIEAAKAPEAEVAASD